MKSRTQLSKAEKFVSDLVHPSRTVSEDQLDEFPTAFIRENKLRLAVETAISEPEFSTEFKTAELVYTEIGRVTQTLEENDIEYAIIKSILPIPKQIGDIDILVDDLPKAEAHLKAMGYHEESRQPYKRKLHRETELGRVAVHLHNEIAWHGQIYLNKTDVLTDTVVREYPGGEAAIPCPSHEALIIAAHMLFEKGNNKIILLDVLSFWEWYEKGELDLDLMRTIADNHGWGPGIRYYLSATSDVYKQIYEQPFTLDDEFPSPDEFPVTYDRLYRTFPIRLKQMYSIRSYRLSWVAQNTTTVKTALCFQTYVRDFVVEIRNRYGFIYSMKRLRQ